MEEIKQYGDKSILAITDFSESSTNAMLYVSNLFKDKKLKLTLLNVFENPRKTKAMLIVVDDILAQKPEELLKKQSAQIISILKRENLGVSDYLMAGELRKAISNITQSEEIDLIVSGIPSDQYPFKNWNNLPLLFIGQSRYPILIVPENYSGEHIKNVLVLNFDAHQAKLKTKKYLENIVNQEHLSSHIINIFKNKIDDKTAALFKKMLAKQKMDIIIVLAAPGDSIDRAMLQFQVQELCPAIAAKLN